MIQQVPILVTQPVSIFVYRAGGEHTLSLPAQHHTVVPRPRHADRCAKPQGLCAEPPDQRSNSAASGVPNFVPPSLQARRFHSLFHRSKGAGCPVLDPGKGTTGPTGSSCSARTNMAIPRDKPMMFSACRATVCPASTWCPKFACSACFTPTARKEGPPVHMD